MDIIFHYMTRYLPQVLSRPNTIVQSLPRLCGILSIVLLLAACQQSNTAGVTNGSTLPPIEDVVAHTSFSSQVEVSEEWYPTRGLSIGYVWPDEMDIDPMQRRQTVENRLQEGEPFAPFLLLKSERETTMLVSMLLDYQQIEFELDGKKGLLHEVPVKPGGDLQIPIKVDIDEPGVHDLVVLAFADPYNDSVDPEYRMDIRSTTVARRAVVIVGDEALGSPPLPGALSGRPVPADVSLGLGVAFAKADDGVTHPSERQLYVTDATAGERFEYQLWVSNLEKENASHYAIVTFLNFHQVPLDGQDMSSVFLQPDEELIMDRSVRLPEEPGVNQLEMIYLFDPYRSVLREEVEAAVVFDSWRIALDTRP